MGLYAAEYILRSEYECPHCKKLPPSLKNLDDPPVAYMALFDWFKLLREEWNKGIPITSGYRCPVHNQAVGGELTSIHMFGLALDCNFKDAEEVTIFGKIVDDIAPELRMGLYRDKYTFAHIDVGYLINPKLSEAWREGARWVE